VKIKEYLEVLDKDFRSMTFRRIFILLLFTLIYWLLRIVMGYIILYSLGLKVGFIPIIFINGITILISLIPIQTIAGFGIFEFSWGYLLSQMGYVYDSILPIILVLHIIIFLTTALYGLIGFFILLLKKDNYAL
jgi:uncharacterized protein (TIRG00374 family)